MLWSFYQPATAHHTTSMQTVCISLSFATTIFNNIRHRNDASIGEIIQLGLCNGHNQLTMTHMSKYIHLTHWGRVTHICVSKLTIICSYNGLSPGRRQAIIWTNAGILLIGPLGTNFSEILIEIQTFSFKKMHLKMSSGKWRPSCLRLNVLIQKDWWYNHNKNTAQ